jgi:hypothetical protein
LGLVVAGLLTFALLRQFLAVMRSTDVQGKCLQAAFMMVLMMTVHSQFEYPLWYTYFLFPTAFAFGLGLGREVDEAQVADARAPVPARRSPSMMGAGAIVLAAGVVTVVDYGRVVTIFSAESTVPLSQRIAAGQRSWFFAHHADYAAATTAPSPGQAMPAFERATHYLLDTRLMIAWAKAHAERGDIDRARHLAQRLREFRNDDAKEFFAPCDSPDVPPAELPFQCSPPSRVMDFRDFR